MSRVAGETEIADAASGIDLADNPAANEFVSNAARRAFNEVIKAEPG